MTDPFAYQRGVWAYAWTQQAERSAEAIVQTCQQFGVTLFCQEVLYGATWQGDIDNRHGLPLDQCAPRSVTGLIALHDRLAAAGITLVPVVVPRTPSDVALHASVAQVCGSVLVDMEVDASGDYWLAHNLVQVPDYAEQLRQLAPGAHIGWEPDGRVIDAGRGEKPYLADQIAPFVDAFVPQLYCGWPAYGLGEPAIAADYGRLVRWSAVGRPVYPTLYTSGSLAEPLELWRRAAPVSTGYVGFRFGAMGPRELAALRDQCPLPDRPAPPPPPPPPDPGPTLDQVKLGFIDKTLRGRWTELRDDLLKITGAAT